MKKLLAATLVLVMTLLCAGMGFAETVTEAEAPVTLTVGLTSKMSGHFFTDKWGLNTADIDIRELIHGHNTIAWEQNGDYAINETVIARLDAYADGADKTYRITLNDGLTYNDGTPITAWDYAFSALLLSSPQFNALGGAPTGLDYLKGYEEFASGGAFAGVSVLNERTLELTLDGRYLPYFYEIVLLNLTPYPIQVIAPDCEVKDDGNGAYIDGPFTEELLRETVLNEQNGYLYHPEIAAGPYILKSFDVESQTAKFTKNPHYSGNFEGVIPTFEEITVVYADQETALDDIESGKLDLVNKISDGALIADGVERVGEDRLRRVNYLRSGLSFIAFACEMGPTQSAEVRKAVALSVDVNAVNQEFTQGFGTPVYGYYGMGQWMALANYESLAAYEKAVDLAEAVRLLESDGWTLNEAGEAYDDEQGGARWRIGEDGELEKLMLKWAQSEETALSAVLEAELRANLESIGVEIEITRLPFDELLSRYYRQTEREYNMFSLATNFNLAFDPYPTFHTGDEYQGEANKTGLIDEELMNLALAMRQTEVGDDAAYSVKWLEFQSRFSEMQPMVPLFCNVYFDFFRTDLQEYYSNAYTSWATAVVYAYIGEPMPEEPDENAEGGEADEADEDYIVLD